MYTSYRPHLIEFLDACVLSFELILFTASEREYADKVIAIFDPQDKYFAHRLYREHCTYVGGIYVKDLGSLGRPLETTILVDNSIHAFACHVTNGVPIPSFFG